ncbi:S1 family peptidase [Paenibacillus koleovorans]|uniref:S1 family peptidase n=1 Tax=Paenibacillus koleovorans TaxID=121608 RepID=UPI000FDB93A6|nr:serine protease [Paenibacillus koleovorans]
MRRKLLAICLFVTVLSGSFFFLRADADVPPVYDAEQIYERSESAVFYIRVLYVDDKVQSTGTGVLLSPEGIAVTAFHVLKEEGRIMATLYDGRVVGPLEVVATDEEQDLAVLKLPDPAPEESPYPMLEIRRNPVKHGEKTFAIGFPFKNTSIITEGIVSTPKVDINGRDRILTTAQIASGMSGGPLIDKQGQLIGVISGSLRTMNNIHLIVSTEALLRLWTPEPK